MPEADIKEKNEDLKEEDLIHLRQWLGMNKHLPYVTDEMLILFHHSCYYDLAKTKDCIEAYYTMRTNAPELFTNRDITSPELVKALEGMYFPVMPVTDPRGYRIICNGLRDPDPAKYSHIETNKILDMTIDSCLSRYGAMPGVVIIHDMKGAKFSHLTKCSLSGIKKVTLYNQDAMPVRLKEIHVINVVSWIDTAISIIKPFMKKEMLDLFHFYTSDDIESLYKIIPKECLPKEYGGTLDTIEALDAENTQYLKSMRDFFAEEEKCRVDESKREKRKKKNNKEEEAVTMFRRLDID